MILLKDFSKSKLGVNMKKFLKLIFCMMLLSICCLIPTSYTTISAEDVDLGNKIVASEIPDSNLRSYLNTLATKLGYNALYENIFKDETLLVLENRNFTTLEGLEKFNFENVTYADFSDNQIDTIPQNAFYSMKKLKTLDLSNNVLKTLNLTIYAQDINLSNNILTNIYIKDNYVSLLDLSNNQIKKSSNIQIVTTQASEEFDIVAYNNYMAGNNNLSNAYLGVQNIADYVSKDEDCDYELYSNSSAYQLYIYPLREVCIGKDSVSGNLLYEKIYCDLYLLDHITGQYNLVKRFNQDDNIQNTNFESYKPASGYYKIKYVTQSGNPIYALDSDYNIVTEKDYDNNPVNVVDKRYSEFVVKAKPYEGSGNVYMVYKDKIYDVELSTKGPIEITLGSTIKNVTFKYLLNNSGQKVVDGETIPFETNKVVLDKTSMYVITVRII